MPLTPHEHSDCIADLRQALPALQGIYLFGSQASGAVHEASDVDLAVLLPTPMGVEQRWELAGQLASRLDRDVDLVDLRASSTILQYQVLTEGQPLWMAGQEAVEFELAAISEYWDLAIQRRELVDDIKQRGRIHGR